MCWLRDKLSPRLYGFLPQWGTHHCLMELYTRLSFTSVVAFIDLKGAFDVANRDIILDQLVEFGIKGNPLRWIRDYLRHRQSRVLFKDVCSHAKDFELGTPQGDVLSPFLFNIIHRLLSLLPEIDGTTITCYVGDICSDICSDICNTTFTHFLSQLPHVDSSSPQRRAGSSHSVQRELCLNSPSVTSYLCARNIFSWERQYGSLFPSHVDNNCTCFFKTCWPDCSDAGLRSSADHLCCWGVHPCRQNHLYCVPSISS